MIKKIYHYVNEASESENKNSSEISEQNGTTCRYVQSRIQNFIKKKNPPNLEHQIIAFGPTLFTEPGTI